MADSRSWGAASCGELAGTVRSPALSFTYEASEMQNVTMSPWWQEIGTTLQEEFSDLPSLPQVVRVFVRLFLAAILGGALGFEREQKGKSAGIRTHMLVALGSALFVFIPEQLGMHVADISRVLQGVIAGVGFLGAGTIIKGKEEENVKGLTTAAGIWLTAAIGVAAGMGREATAVLSTILALIILTLVPRFAGLIDRRRG
jgi:putative Mg2+ transporter-C (MgtC) family protein